ncbi:hypothetical protein [Bacillus mycoides]|nr:hypothetical protein [Bacillus mycoides]
MKDIYKLLNHIKINNDDFKEIRTTELEKNRVKERLFISINKQKHLNK